MFDVLDSLSGSFFMFPWRTAARACLGSNLGVSLTMNGSLTGFEKRQFEKKTRSEALLASFLDLLSPSYPAFSRLMLVSLAHIVNFEDRYP